MYFKGGLVWVCFSVLGVLALFPLNLLAQKEPPHLKPIPPKNPQPPGRILSGNLVIFSAPANAQIFINQQLRATTSADGDLKKPLTLKPGRYSITIKHPEYEPLNQQVSIRAGESTPVKAALTPRFGFLLLTIPDGKVRLQIELDGKELDKKDMVWDSANAIRLKTLLGEHTIKVTSRGFKPFSSTVTLKDAAPIPIPVSLEREQVSLLIKSLPGARVYLNGEETGVIPTDGKLVMSTLFPGKSYKVLVERDGYEKSEQTITPELDQVNRLEFSLVPLPTSSEFADTFDGDLSLWNAPPDWVAEKGLLHVRGRGVGLPKEKWYCDGEIRFGLKLEDTRGAAWVIRAQDQTNYYLFILNGPTGKTPNKFQVFQCKNGVLNLNQPLSPPLPVPILEKGDTCRIRIVLTGNVIEHFMTPTKTGEEISIGVFKDSNNTFSCGNAGFITLNQEDFFVHGFVIKPR